MMSTYTLDGWKNTTSTALIGILPKQDFNSALSLVGAYLSNHGGWIPVDPMQPVSFGNPATEEQPFQAAKSIANEELAKLYDAEITIPVTLNFRFIKKFIAGLTDQDAINSMQIAVRNWLSDKINSDEMPITIEAFGSISGSVVGNGVVSAAQRADLASSASELDYKSIALERVLKQYPTTDSNWNVSEVYVDDDNPITVLIDKYTDSTYLTLDPTSTVRYVVGINPDTYQIVSLMSLPTT